MNVFSVSLFIVLFSEEPNGAIKFQQRVRQVKHDFL